MLSLFVERNFTVECEEQRGVKMGGNNNSVRLTTIFPFRVSAGLVMFISFRESMKNYMAPRRNVPLKKGETNRAWKKAEGNIFWTEFFSGLGFEFMFNG